MTDEGTTQGTEGTKGQPGGEPGGSQTTAPGTAGTDGQSGAAGSQGTTQTGTTTTTEETFFDPKDLTDELMPAYKNMQRAFSKKTEGIKADRQKVEAYDAFMTDPMNQLQQLASRYGYRLDRLQGTGQQTKPENWEPQNWDEVISRSKTEARDEVLNELKPMLGQIQNLRKTSMERMLDDSCPDWRTYEDDMMTNLKSHPTLVNDPAKLYLMSVPPDVLESLATQRALKKLESKTDSARPQGSSTKKDQGADMPNKSMTFAESVAFAKAKLAKEGMTK